MSILHRVHGHAKRHYEKHYAARYASRAHLVFLLDAVLVSCALGLLLLGSYFSWFYHPLRDAFKLNVTVAGEAVGGELWMTQPVGMLGDVAPTILKLLELPQPAEMTGRSLI